MWRAICACAASPSRLMSAKRRTCFAINPACSSPPWREIFAADAERKQDFAEAQATYQAMVAVYSGLGYELVTLPLASVAERVRFVRAAIEREESYHGASRDLAGVRRGNGREKRTMNTIGRASGRERVCQSV